MYKFIEENSKWIVIVLVAIGLTFILKLWSIGASTTCPSSGWINICIIPEFKYYWISAGYISILFFVISFFLIYLIKKTKKKLLKIKIAFIIFILGMIGNPIFFLVSPDFKFYLTSVTKQYKDKDGNLTNIDKYLELTTKYCDNFKEGDEFNFKYSRETMCSGKFEPNFKTVDEYIKVLEYAKNNDFRYLYQLTLRWADDNVGLGNLIDNYNDDTFQGYIVYNNYSNEVRLNLIKEISKNKDVLELIYFIEEILKDPKMGYKWELAENMSDYNKNVFYRQNFNIMLKSKVKTLSKINYKVF